MPTLAEKYTEQTLRDFEVFKAACAEPEHNYIDWGETSLANGWGFTPFAWCPNGSDVLAESNYRTVVADLTKRFPDSFEDQRVSHWVVGKLDQLRVKLSDQEAMQALHEWWLKLQDYPVASEDDWTALEDEYNYQAYDTWAEYDVRRACEKEGITALLDENGNFSPTPEQEETLRSLVGDYLWEHDGSGDFEESEDFASMLHAAFDKEGPNA